MVINKILTGTSPYEKLEKAENEQAKAKRDKGADEAQAGDRISLSEGAKLRTEAHKAAQDAPEIRREKVEAIKAKIAAGEYEIDAQKVAQKMVEEDLDLLI
jgi:negative regulator of flagellin synthesis FlgM